MVWSIILYFAIGFLANMAITAYFIVKDEETYGFRNPVHDESLGYILLWPVFVVTGIGLAILYVVRNIGGSTGRAAKRLWSK